MLDDLIKCWVKVTQVSAQQGIMEYVTRDASGQYILDEGKRENYHQIQTMLAGCSVANLSSKSYLHQRGYDDDQRDSRLGSKPTPSRG